jgi:hypothetical protein
MLVLVLPAPVNLLVPFFILPFLLLISLASSFPPILQTTKRRGGEPVGTQLGKGEKTKRKNEGDGLGKYVLYK